VRATRVDKQLTNKRRTKDEQKTNKRRTKDEQKTNKRRIKDEQKTNKWRCEPHRQIKKRRRKEGASRTGRWTNDEQWMKIRKKKPLPIHILSWCKLPLWGM